MPMTRSFQGARGHPFRHWASSGWQLCGTWLAGAGVRVRDLMIPVSCELWAQARDASWWQDHATWNAGSPHVVRSQAPLLEVPQWSTLGLHRFGGAGCCSSPVVWCFSFSLPHASSGTYPLGSWALPWRSRFVGPLRRPFSRRPRCGRLLLFLSACLLPLMVAPLCRSGLGCCSWRGIPGCCSFLFSPGGGTWGQSGLVY